jgi:hypothetical protein
MNRTTILLALSTLVVYGCVAQRSLVRYTKPGATQDEFMKDRYECLQEAQQRESGAYVNSYGGAASSRVVASCGVWLSCLGARGYTVDPNGPLGAPPGMEVRCRR